MPMLFPNFGGSLGGGGGGGLTAPTRTTQALSGGTVDIAIPAGVTWFRFSADPITMSSTADDCYAALVASSTEQAFTGHEFQLDGATIAALSGDVKPAYAGSEASNTTRFLTGKVVSPLSVSKKTLVEAFGGNTSQDRSRWATQDTAAAADTFRLNANGSTFAGGSVEIEWSYN